MTQTQMDSEAGGPRIVVGIDGSDSSVGALGWAARQAEMTGGALEVVMTWDWPISYGWTIPYPAGFDPSESAQRVLDETVAAVRKEHPGLRLSSRLAEGHPAPILIEESKRATLLVVGSRGHGEFAGMLLGSVSEHCATHAHCPVLVHRQPD
jgi:nucleotide-binding universal stress UspA family protein